MSDQNPILRIKRIRNLPEVEQNDWDCWDILLLERVADGQKDEVAQITKTEIFTFGAQNSSLAEILSFLLNLLCNFTQKYDLNLRLHYLLANCSAEEVVATIKKEWPELSKDIYYEADPKS